MGKILSGVVEIFRKEEHMMQAKKKAIESLKYL